MDFVAHSSLLVSSCHKLASKGRQDVRFTSNNNLASIRSTKSPNGRSTNPLFTAGRKWQQSVVSVKAVDQQGQDLASVNEREVPTSDVWQLDFCSRPILDERGKKVWELLICDPARQFEYAKYFPNNKINSAELKKALAEVLAQPGARKPESVLFFRSQMQTIITRALNELDIKAVPSRRCFSLIRLLEERIESVYKKDPGYSDKSTTLFTLNMGAPEELPDALRGESWSFVQLPLGALKVELEQVTQGNAFGSTLDIDSLGIDVDDNTLVPGVAVYSRRAAPMAAWTKGLELAAVVADTDRASLVLETGVTERWKYGAYRRTPETTEEAQAWEDAKKAVGGLHFLAVMTDEEAEDCSGLWLLFDKQPPNV
jgi:hypothetical protein